MEKGSFQTPLKLQETLETAVRKIPLPNQLPKGIDFSEIPVEHLRSATLESLINQNEDLMARLSVALRRTNEFEERVHSLEADNSALRSRLETLKEQYLLTQEKDRISTSRSLLVQEENVNTKRQIEKLEKAYSELFIQAQAFQQQVMRLERNQSRLRKAAKTLQKNNKTLPLVREALTRTQEEKREQLSSHQQTIQVYEVKLAGVRDELDAMRPKINERDSLYADKVRLENQIVYSQRQFEVRSEEQTQAIKRLSEENTAMRVQLKEALVATEGARQEASRLSAELPSLRAEKQNLIEQVESLQALWSHKQSELESSEQKNRSLQKLNQSLSTTLNQQRKDIHRLEQEIEKERLQSGEKIKTLLAEIQMLNAKL